MRVLITGGAGFIGSHLVDRLVALGHQVLVMDNLSTGRASNLPREALLEVVDLRDGSGLVTTFRRFDPEVVFHLAAQISVGRSIAEPLLDAEMNVMASLRLMDLARLNGAYFIFASSGGAIYGEASSGPQNEDHPERPINPYGASKLAVDTYLRAFRHQYGLGSCSMRFSNVYGPRQPQAGEAAVVPRFMEAAVRGEALRIFGSGEQTRDFVFVGDLVDLVPLLIARRPQGVLNLGSGQETSILDLARMVQKVAGEPPRLVMEAGKPGEQSRSVLDPRRAFEVLGWSPRTSLREGLETTLAWMKVAVQPD
jgi:UDP-glucose 4-epimerase